MSVEKKNIIVTGGAAGIGLATVKLLLKEGASKCVILDVNETVGKKVAADLTAEFGDGRVIFERLDIANKPEFENVVDKVMKKLEKLDIFINNAGIGDEIRWEQTVKINLEGPIKGCQLALKYMSKENGKAGGIVINICSVLGLCPEMSPVYSASKSGLIGYTRCIAEQRNYVKSGVAFMALCPGPTDTDLLGKGLSSSEEPKEIIEAKIMEHGGMQVPDDVAKCVLQILKNCTNGSIWVSAKREPAYQYIFKSIEKDA